MNYKEKEGEKILSRNRRNRIEIEEIEITKQN